MALKENAKKVFQYLQEINGQQDVTSADVAEVLGLGTKQVDGIFTRVIQTRGYGVRVPAEKELEDGTHKKVKYLVLNEDGLNFDCDAE